MSKRDVVPASEFTEHVDAEQFRSLGLTGQELEFVHQFVKNHGDAEMAAVKAGYTPQHGYVLTKRLPILEAIRRYVLMEFQTDAVEAKSVLMEVLRDAKTPATVRRQCAMDILNTANLAGGTLLPPGSSGKMMDISNLTEEEKDKLEELLAKTCRDPAKPNSNVIDVTFTETRNGKSQTKHTGADSDG